MSEAISPAEIDASIARYRALPALHRARITISELFVDTELDALALASIAERLLETEIDATELARIYREEIAPICSSHAPVGVWPAFDIQWLNERIEATRSGWRARLPNFVVETQRNFATRSSRSDWAQIMAYLRDPKALRDRATKLRSSHAIGDL
jgi:hypothetical protein